MRRRPRHLRLLWFMAALLVGGARAFAQQPVLREPVREQEFVAPAGSEFVYPIGADISRTGVLSVLDWAGRVVQFDESGTNLRVWGRAGSGPGDFRNPVAIGRSRDTLWTADVGLRRLTLFSDDGRSLRTISAQLPVQQGQFFGVVPMAYLPTGRVLASYSTSQTNGEDHGAAGIPVLEIRGDSVVREIGRTNPPPPWLIQTRAGLRHALQPIHDRPFFVHMPEGTSWVRIQRGAAVQPGAASFTVERSRFDGSILFKREIAYTAERIPSARIEAALAMYPGAHDARATLKLPPTLPAISAVFCATDGSIWLKRDRASGRGEWLVLDSTGTHVASVHLHRTARLLAAKERRLWVVEEDDDGATRVFRYRR